MTLLLWLSFLVVVGAGDEVEGRSHVTVLTESIFDSFIQSKAASLVQFYAPWCAHCQKLEPEYERAAKILAGEADLAKLDCTSNKQLCEKHQVKGFPTINFYRSDGSSEPYEDEREARAIVRYMRKQSRPSYVFLNTDVEVTEFSQRDFNAVAWLQQASGTEFNTLVAVAHSLRNDCEFGIVTNPQLLIGKLLPTLIVYKQFDDREVQFSSEWTETGLRSFIQQERFPLVGGIVAANYSRYVNRGLPILWLFVDPENEVSAQIIAVAEVVAKPFQGQISVVVLDGVRWVQHARALGVETLPGAVVQMISKNEKI
jgi:protein disulfide-isomerase A1